MQRLRVAFVGCGLISQSHLKAYLAHENWAQIVAAYDPARERADAIASECGATVVDSFEAILADEKIDAVELMTPHHLHLEQTRQALAANKHVLLQKPLGRTLEECDEIVKLGQSSDRVLYYGELSHTTQKARTARQAYRQGRIGRMVALQGTYAHWQGGDYLHTGWRYDPSVSGGGALLDGGIHTLATMITVAGPVHSVSAMTTRFRPELGGEDTSVVSITFANGALGTLLSSHASHLWPPGPSVRIIGEDGILSMGGTETLGLYRDDLPEQREVLIEEWLDPFESMIGAYLDCVVDGQELASSAELGRHEFAVVMAAYRSAEEGRTILISEM